MTTIAISGVPPRLTMPLFIKKLSWIVKGHFQALGCEQKKKNEKICYVKLSPKLNVKGVIGKINSTPFGKFQLKAYVPHTIPKLAQKKKVLPDRLRRLMHIPIEMDEKTCFEHVHLSIIREMEHKYTGLHKLSKKSNHKLMENICLTVRDRLRVVANNAPLDNPFKFSSAYRKAHPHFGDFQFILSTLHMIEDAQGQQRSQIVEKELILQEDDNANNDLLLDKMPETCKKYSERIIKKVMEHVKTLKTQPSASPTEEEKARIAVRTQIMKLTPYLKLMIREVMAKYFQAPKNQQIVRVKVYGEPYLPNKDMWEPFVRQFKARSVFRSDKVFNLLSFKVNASVLGSVLKADGTVLGSCKLIIRGPDVETYTFPDSLKNQITLFPGPGEENVQLDENWEQW